MQDRRYSTWKQLLVFALAGPLVGSLALLISLHIGGQMPFDLQSWLGVTFTFGYIVGLTPALATGCIAALVRAKVPNLSRWSYTFRFIVPVTFGAAASMVFSLAFLTSELDASLALAGAIAAIACTAWIEWRASAHPDKSFNPDALKRAG